MNGDSAISFYHLFMLLFFNILYSNYLKFQLWSAHQLIFSWNKIWLSFSGKQSKSKVSLPINWINLYVYVREKESEREKILKLFIYMLNLWISMDEWMNG